MHGNHEVRYIIRGEDITNFQEKFTTVLEEKHGATNSAVGRKIWPLKLATE
jgi:hypothetical protein